MGKSNRATHMNLKSTKVTVRKYTKHKKVMYSNVVSKKLSNDRSHAMV
jgi:hypothetical protein